MVSVQVHPSDRQTSISRRARAARPKHGSCWRRGRKAAFTRASSRTAPRTFCGGRSRTRRSPTTLPASRRGPATPYFCEPGPFTRWAVPRGVRGAGKQRRDFSPLRLEPHRRPDRTASISASRSGACLLRSAQTAVGPVTPVVEATTPVLRERLFHCEHFSVWRLRGASPFTVGAAGTPRVLVCIAGKGELEHDGAVYPVGHGDVMLLPAEVGTCSYRPSGDVSLVRSRAAGIGPARQDRGGERSQELRKQ